MMNRVHLFLDNTSSTNKNCYLMAWAYEMVQQEKLSFFRVSFLLAGIPSFPPTFCSPKYHRPTIGVMFLILKN